MSRTGSSFKNLITALIGQFLGVIITFVSRMVFLRFLNEEYLGLNGLFSNILSVFALVELGVGPAMNFVLYKPLADHNTECVKNLMMLYRKIYIVIGCAIAALGLVFTPFYTLLMAEVPAIPNLTLIYWLFTANTAISYFFSYKRALIICDEKRYIATLYRYGFYIGLNFVQIIFLVVTKNYILYLVLQIIFTFGENICISIKADQMYPYLKERQIQDVSHEMVADIRKNVKAMIFHKIGGMVVLSTDNLILSRFVGLRAVGLYSNYFLITDALNKIINQIFGSITASVGNLNACGEKRDGSDLKTVFDRTFFANFWIYGFCTCCIYVLINPFISLWLGKKLLFDRFTVLIIVINFYFTGMRRAALTFHEATGAFYYDRHKPLAESLINIIASILLARKLGTAGVFLGTIISTLTTSIWIEPLVLYKHVFHTSMQSYMVALIKYTGLTIFTCVLTRMISDRILLGNVFLCFGLKLCTCIIVPNVIFWLCFRKSKHLYFFFTLAKTMLKKGQQYWIVKKCNK